MRTVFTLRAALHECSRESLCLVYEQQMEFARFHNALVWQVSSIFIPFSFAGLAVDFESDVQLRSVAWGSIAILAVWTVLAEWHRWMWVHSFYIAGVIENLLSIRDEPPKAPSFLNFSPPQFIGLPVRHARFDYGRILRLAFGVIGVAFWAWRLGEGVACEWFCVAME
jgi:hypothetical protein